MADLTAWLCGVDEAGRGPLAGPVFAAAVLLGKAGRMIVGLDDSKKLSAPRRESLAVQIRDQAQAWAIASATAREVDELNILKATMLAMFRAIERMPDAQASTNPHIVIDGTQIPRSLSAWAAARNITVVAQPRADAEVPEVSAASILAKTARDAYMLDVHARFPHYGFAAHKGYGTAAHMAALTQHGPCEEHRRSFAPVSQLTLI